MSQSTEERIAIDGLLIKREADYARVFEIETEINELLGADYPFPAPDFIPLSKQKRKRPKSSKALKSSNQEKPLKLRRLKPEECAYRYTWLEHGKQNEAEALSPTTVIQFLKDPPTGVKLLSVQTINYNGEPLETLH